MENVPQSAVTLIPGSPDLNPRWPLSDYCQIADNGVNCDMGVYQSGMCRDMAEVCLTVELLQRHGDRGSILCLYDRLLPL